VWKRIKFPTFWYNCYYFTWSDTYFIQLETLLINHPSYNCLSSHQLMALIKNMNVKFCFTNTVLDRPNFNRAVRNTRMSYFTFSGLEEANQQPDPHHKQQDTICCKYLSLTLLMMGKILPETC